EEEGKREEEQRREEEEKREEEQKREKEARSFEGTQKEETDVKSPKTEKRGLMGKMRNALQALRKAREVDRRMERWDEDIEMRRYMAGLEGTDQMPGETSHEQDGERREGPVILVITSPSTSELNKACQCQSNSKLTRKEKKERRKLQKRQSEELRKNCWSAPTFLCSKKNWFWSRRYGAHTTLTSNAVFQVRLALLTCFAK
ncbi:vicilin-like seed storage protein At2g18540, partial [Colossoma macropomum]|uniref:vicilin-like seed storage protein At2g18540 n=1 Tax=Colossoma macropomum TaxID=42526 RepID=UPI001864AEDD